MSLVSFSCQVHSLLKCQDTEDNSALRTAVKNADTIVTRYIKHGPQHHEPSREFLARVYACFDNFPKMQLDILKIQDDIEREVRGLRTVVRRIFVHKHSRETQSSLPALPSISALTNEVANALWINYTSTCLLKNLFNEFFLSFFPDAVSAQDGFCKLLTKRTEAILSEFLDECKGNDGIRLANIVSVKQQVRKRVEAEIERIKKLNPIKIAPWTTNGGFIGSSILAFTWVEKFTSLRKSSQKLADHVQVIFDYLDHFRDMTHIDPLRLYREDRFKIVRGRWDERKFELREECLSVVPFLQSCLNSSPDFHEMAPPLLLQLKQELCSGVLFSLLRTNPHLWHLLLIHMEKSYKLGITYASEELRLYAHILVSFKDELQNCLRLSEEKVEKILEFFAERRMDPQVALQKLQSSSEMQKEWYTFIFENNLEYIKKFHEILPKMKLNILQPEG